MGIGVSLEPPYQTPPEAKGLAWVSFKIDPITKVFGGCLFKTRGFLYRDFWWIFRDFWDSKGIFKDF